MSINGGEEPGKPTVEELRAGVDSTREDLAETVDALAARLDVKARATERLKEPGAQRVVAGLAIAVLASLVVLGVRRARRP